MSTASSKITDHLRPLLRSQTACGLAIVAFLTVGWFAWQTYGQVALAFTAVAGLGFAIAVFRYPILGLAIATFLLTSHLERYLPKVQTPLLAFVILSAIFWKLFNKDLSFRFAP